MKSLKLKRSKCDHCQHSQVAHLVYLKFIRVFTFHAVNEIKSVPLEIFKEGYWFMSLDVESLFMNVKPSKLF